MKDSKPSKITPPLKDEVVPADVLPKQPPKVELFYRPKRLGGYINLYAIEQIRVEDDVVVERKMITERDNLDITMSKIMLKLEDALRG